MTQFLVKIHFPPKKTSKKSEKEAGTNFFYCLGQET